MKFRYSFGTILYAFVLDMVCFKKKLIQIKLTLNTAYPAAANVASTTPPSVGLPVIPSMYANNAIPVSHIITATIYIKSNIK